MNDEIVFPGDIVKDVKSMNNVTILGPGLQRKADEFNTLLITKAGKLHFKPPNIYWVESRNPRYIPRKEDLVVGIVTKKTADFFKVDIGSSKQAVLSVLSFEGVTKKQKPDLQIGDAVYAKVLTAYREMEPELICIDSYFKAGKLGVLNNNGFIINVTPDLAFRLLNPDNPLLRTLGKKIPFETAIGLNGKIWLNARRSDDILNIIRIIESSKNESDSNIKDFCKKF